VQAVLGVPVPKISKEVRAFHGLCNRFWRFIPNFGEAAKVLAGIFKKYAKLRWTDVQKVSHLMNLLCVAQVLVYCQLSRIK
jgi:hypothetical protein